MAFAVVQVGAALKLLADDGTLTALTLPTGVTLREDVAPRWILADRYAVLVNTPDQPLIIDGTGTVRLLCPKPPRVAAVVSDIAGGTLTGNYAGIRYTFITFDTDGNIISESDYSPASGSATLATDFLKAASLDLSPDTISGRRLYRPVTDGTVLFQWVDLDGNTLTEVQDDLSDAGLSLVASPILGTPPHLTHVASFRGRLFGVGSDDIDHVRYTEAGVRYAWPADNLFEIPIVGSDSVGITGFLQRREALGVGRTNQLAQITGSGAEDPDSGTIDFDVVLVSKEVGITSQEAVDVYRDTGYFLWQDGVYEWGPDGISCVSDGKVRSWFATEDYFDRSRFAEAFGHVDPLRLKYRLYLYDADGAVWWVEFDLRDRTWWGPHKTDLFTPSSVLMFQTDAQVRIPLVGGIEGTLYQEQEIRTDGASTPIDFDVITKRHDMGAAHLDKYFGEISIVGKAQDAGRLTVITRTGALNATKAKTQYYDMRRAEQTLGRLGTGNHAQVEFRHAVANQPVELYGYEIRDIHGTGRR